MTCVTCDDTGKVTREIGQRVTQQTCPSCRGGDNGEMHYGVGLPGAICGCHSPTRRETPDKARVTCVECKKVMKRTGR